MMLGQGPAAMPQLPPPPSTAGFPSSYPYAYSAPLPSAILRPLQQPLYDTEVLLAAAPQAAIRLFQLQLGQAMADGTIKTFAETNLTQPGQLANPLEFSLFGFNFVVLPQVPATAPFVTQRDFMQITSNSAFTFTYTGNRIYLQLPLHRIPAGVSAEGFSALDAQAAPAERTNIHQGVGHISNFYKFTIGRSALRIRPTEAFAVTVDWPTVVPVTPASNTRLQVFLLGLTWSAL